MGTVGPDYITQQVLDRICDHMADGNSVRSYFRDIAPELNRNWFHVWMKTHATDEQRTQYARAEEDRQDAIFEQCLDIADETSRDTITIHRDEGDDIERPNSEWINRSRLRVDTRLKMLARMNPKKYGERINQAISDPDGKPLPASSPVQVYLPDNGRDTPSERV